MTGRPLPTKPKWLESIFPWQQQSIIVNGRNMAYVEDGPADGRPVLLLSGNPTWGFLYRDFFEPLAAAGYRPIAPDWIGSGYSDHPRVDSALTFAHHVADLVSFIDQLGLDSFVMVGQDWGGPQGLAASLQRRDSMAGLVLMSTWAFTGEVGKFHTSPKPWTTWHAPLIGQFFMKRLKVLSQHGPSTISRRGMSEAEARAYHHVFDEPDADNVVLTWPRTIPMLENDRGWQDMTTLESRLAEIGDAPTLLMWGMNDGVFGESYAKRLKTHIPHAEGPVAIDDADHFMQDDKGAEIAAAITDFLKRTLPANVTAPRKVDDAPHTAATEESWQFAWSKDSIDDNTVRCDPLLSEQELDVRPGVADALEAALGMRAGCCDWQSRHGHRYRLELGDLGRGRPSIATVYGLWPRWEPRPSDSEIDADLLDFCVWVGEISPEINPDDIVAVAGFAGLKI